MPHLTPYNIFKLFLLLAALSVSNAQAQPMRHKGYPSRGGIAQLHANFQNPPKGYGNVPFYWWNGDTLKFERLAEQLAMLGEASTDGLSVSYVHTHPKVDTLLNAHGYGRFGRADAGVPGFYTDEWWQLWNRFSDECARRNIGLGLDDYVVGWARNGYYVDEVLQGEDFRKYQGRLNCKGYNLAAGEQADIQLPANFLCAVAYPDMTNISNLAVDGKLRWKAPKACTLYVMHTTPSPELHPQYGNRIVETYFNRFEEKLDDEGRKGMNYFFQDELYYDLNIRSWCEDMPQEFRKRKGYGIMPYLPALTENAGTIAPKVRLDYAQVVTELAEERYFKPIFEWHNSRGLIYGCDNNGRGLNPVQYMDYFRATSWFTAPGNDAPARGSSFRQTKVSSSVTHLYQRPRTWLEAFHSMGWDSNGEWLTSQLDHHIIAGGNLLCMHGLYYSTHGGWWEWAPPCFHFRMPYWPHTRHWLKYAERMCYLLSQGVHVCDIAVLYPTETLHAYPDTRLKLLWQFTDSLSACGMDYDFIDYQSLQRSKTDEGGMSIAGETYKVLVLADIKALHYETLLKIYDFYRNGGIVISVGETLKATSRIGENDSEAERMLNEITHGNRYAASEVGAAIKRIAGTFTPDFHPANGAGKVLHRRIGEQHVYMVMDVPEGDELFFRCHGKVERWNADDGSVTDVPVLRQTAEGTWLRHTASHGESRLYVFSPGQPTADGGQSTKVRELSSVSVDGEWEIEIVPTMDNKWGDFRLPATRGLIGPEAREFAYRFVPAKSDDYNLLADQQSHLGVYGYAPYMETVTLGSGENLDSVLATDLSDRKWESYCYSWQYGVFDSPGSQGYHGLKGKVDDRFIILDKGGHQIFRTYLYAPEKGTYRMEQEGVVPHAVLLDGKRLHGNLAEMEKGWHLLVLAYADTPLTSYTLSGMQNKTLDPRQRSAVVFYPDSHPSPSPVSEYGAVVAMKWYLTNHLTYSPYKDMRGEWQYEFTTAPGTKTMTMQVNGHVKKVYVDGKLLPGKSLSCSPDGTLTVALGRHHSPAVQTIRLTTSPDRGCIGPAFFRSPVAITCEGGKMSIGNWTDAGALKFYSGGIRYTKYIDWDTTTANSQTVLDMGRVNATCQVSVNGEDAGVLIHPPYRADISGMLRPGRNRIDVLVYSTLSNHYQTIPSAYRGTPVSGLLGPVRISTTIQE